VAAARNHRTFCKFLVDSTSDRPHARQAAHLAAAGRPPLPPPPPPPKGYAAQVLLAGPDGPASTSIARHLSPLLAELVGSFFVCLMWAGLVPSPVATTACMLAVRVHTLLGLD